MNDTTARAFSLLTYAAFASVASCGPPPRPSHSPTTVESLAPAGELVSLSTFPGAGSAPPAVLTSVTAAEKLTILAELNDMPRMSVYHPSSCHDRAHALWMLFSESSRSRMAKTWIFSESAYTSVFAGGLLLRGVDMTPWRYHVALVFRDVDGEVVVLDPVRKDWPRPVRLQDWTHQIKRSPESLFPAVQITLKPDLYLFYGHSMAAPANNPGAINTGEFYTYTTADPARKSDTIPRSLGRDDVAVADVATQCLAIVDVLDDADTLQNLLNCASKDDDTTCIWPANDDAKDALKRHIAKVRETCPAVVDLYKSRFDFWKNLLQ